MYRPGKCAFVRFGLTPASNIGGQAYSRCAYLEGMPQLSGSDYEKAVNNAVTPEDDERITAEIYRIAKLMREAREPELFSKQEAAARGELPAEDEGDD